MYTWGYIKEASLAKLDITEAEAEANSLLKKFPYYANEAITQICSSVKPKYTYYDIDVTKDMVWKEITMPEDFISFGEDVNFVAYKNEDGILVEGEEATDEDFEYLGYNKVIFKHEGVFHISYNARWYLFSHSVSDGTVLDVPYDILDCLPSYIASQCYKIDDEVKAQTYRNEFEIAVSRIDVANPRNVKTTKISGGW